MAASVRLETAGCRRAKGRSRRDLALRHGLREGRQSIAAAVIPRTPGGRSVMGQPEKSRNRRNTASQPPNSRNPYAHGPTSTSTMLLGSRRRSPRKECFENEPSLLSDFEELVRFIACGAHQTLLLREVSGALREGTKGSNPLCSSGESRELNFVSPGIASPFSYRCQDSVWRNDAGAGRCVGRAGGGG